MNTMEQAGCFIRINGKTYVEYEELQGVQKRYAELLGRHIALNGEYIKIIASQIKKSPCKMVAMKGGKAV